ncbi:hypothetical protein SAMN02927937_02102 [Paenimyroides aquimaris]|uniref:Uncharacterized protein n=1 Tax=Paenimyroides marinum TaxID=1159016 RepID=A0A1H6LXU2_9FLAO|nr:hypothetical protein [Paenimyroides aquimaris]SEH91352.1 hypothetical protein SAMN02927937_02102 [Paenimyroides aquimaris]
MKKIIESDLISIAHRILKLKDKSEIASLLKETEELHNKLILLQFYEDNKYRLDPLITEEKLLEEPDQTETKEKMPKEDEASSVFLTEEKKDDVVTFEEELITPIELNVTEAAAIDEAIAEENNEVDLEETTEILVDDTVESETAPETDIIEFTPSIEETQKTIEEIDEEIEEIEGKDPEEDAKEAVERATIEIDPVFSLPHTELFSKETDKEENFKAPQHFVSTQSVEKPAENYRQIPLNKSINDAFANKISIGLNDRIAFEKNLFNGNSDDLNRVISQLNTIESYEEAKDFIDDLVKPEFNNWNGKEDYENRFMQLVEKRFL